MLGVMIVLGLIQGLTEFLPVSSSGHLVLMYKLFGVNSDNLLLSIILHVATLLSVIVWYRKQLWTLIKNPFCKTNINLIIATLPTVAIVLIFKQFIESAFGGATLVVGFMLTAILLVVADYMSSKCEFVTQSCDITKLNIKWWQALLVGVSQGIACVPGLSRSGTTISTSLISGVSKQTSTTFSFLLSIPVIVGSLVFELLQGGSVQSVGVFNLIVGFAVAFMVGLFAIKLLNTSVAKGKLYYFSYYLVTIVAIILVFNLV